MTNIAVNTASTVSTLMQGLPDPNKKGQQLPAAASSEPPQKDLYAQVMQEANSPSGGVDAYV